MTQNKRNLVNSPGSTNHVSGNHVAAANPDSRAPAKARLNDVITRLSEARNVNTSTLCSMEGPSPATDGKCEESTGPDSLECLLDKLEFFSTCVMNQAESIHKALG